MDDLSIHISLKNQDVVILSVFARRKQTLWENKDAKEYGESPFQLKEGCIYDFELDKSEYCLKEDKEILTNSRSRQPISRGCISTGIYVGAYSVDVLQREDGQKVGEVIFEICSSKTGYRDDYRRMLEDITEFCTELLMQQSSPVVQRYQVDITKDPKSDYQRFSFVRSVIDSDSFADAMHQIQLSPVKRWIESEEERQLCSVKRWGHSALKQLACATNRSPLPDKHPLKQRFDTLPHSVLVASKKETTDIAENRFVKYVLRTFLTFCSSVQRNPKAGVRLKQEATLVCEKLLHYLSYPIFRNISDINVLPLNSPVLQRKEGYREVFQKWLMFDMAARLTWQGGEDVYHAGKKDVAKLYEYWLFFKLLDVLSKKFRIPAKSKEELIDYNSKSLNLNLKQGKMIMLGGVYETDSRKLNISFSYNRTFGYTKEYQMAGSWTRSFRPDYTLTIWPGDITSEEAEREELITHIHFDAKYRVEQLLLRDTESMSRGKITNDLSKAKEEEERGTYKRADLLKMHAYKDAIRRTGGAYVLYPGTENQTIPGFHEIIPGLGAFAISPKNYERSMHEFLSFLNDVINNFLDRTSMREKLAYHTFSTYKKESSNLREPLPEPYGENRDLLPDETHVLIGYYKNEQQLKWILKCKLYNTRTGSRNGSLHLNKEVISARYLLLHGEGETETGRLYKLVPKGPRVFSKERLEKLGYQEPSGEYYLVYNIEGCAEREFDNMKWDIRLLEGYKQGNLSASIFCVSLADLMRVKVAL